MAAPDVLLHPVRLRIVQALLDGSELTTGELMAALGDTPAATLYRHVAKLAEAGVLTVVSETPVRGAVERRYRLHTPSAVVGPEDARAMGVEGHRRAFAVFVATLLADLDRYLDGSDLDVVRDGLSFGQAALWLTDDELADLRVRIAESIAGFLTNEPAAGRTKRVLTTILIPSG